MTASNGGKTMTGELDPRFRIRAPLRCDGIGSLDCAEDTDSGMRMAIRWLPLDANGDAAAQAMQQLPTHPTLPKIRKTGRVGAAAYVAMEFPDGRLLSTLDETLPPVELCRMGAEIADALATVHAQGVFHGELCADSLLVLPGHRSILWDLPLVIANRLTDRRGEERVMASLVRMGPFLAPERAQGLPPSSAADVYALGAVLCLYAGGRPPSGATTLAVIHQIAAGRWTPEVPERLPEPVRALLSRMVDRDALARPSPRMVATALGRHLATLPAGGPEVPVAPRRVSGDSAVALSAEQLPVLAEGPVHVSAAVRRTFAPGAAEPSVVVAEAMVPAAPVVFTPPAAAPVASGPLAKPVLAVAAAPRAVVADAGEAVTGEVPMPRLPRAAVAVGLAVVAVLSLGGVAFRSWTAAPAPKVQEPESRPAAVTVVRKRTVDRGEDVLAPLPSKAASAPTKRAVSKRGPVRSEAAEPEAPAAPAVKHSAAAGQVPTKDDFNFLPTGFDKPQSELKRPAF